MPISNVNLDIATDSSSCQQQARSRSCYLEWMVQQKDDLDELIQVSNQHPDNDEKLLPVIQTIMKHFKEYNENRIKTALNSPHSLFSPSWCSTLENSYLWIGGCRPSLVIRLVYTLCGLEAESQLAEFLQGVSKGNLGDLSASQLQMLDELQGKIVKEEKILSSRMASMQEDVADQLFAVIAHGLSTVGESEVGRAIDEHAVALARILEDADNLRVSTLTRLIDILTPLQTVDLLLATKKLHLSMHEWGVKIDCQHGRA